MMIDMHQILACILFAQSTLTRPAYVTEKLTATCGFASPISFQSCSLFLSRKPYRPANMCRRDQYPAIIRCKAKSAAELKATTPAAPPTPAATPAALVQSATTPVEILTATMGISLPGEESLHFQLQRHHQRRRMVICPCVMYYAYV